MHLRKKNSCNIRLSFWYALKRQTEYLYYRTDDGCQPMFPGAKLRRKLYRKLQRNMMSVCYNGVNKNDIDSGLFISNCKLKYLGGKWPVRAVLQRGLSYSLSGRKLTAIRQVRWPACVRVFVCVNVYARVFYCSQP